MISGLYFEWFTALHDALVAGKGDVTEGERNLRAHYLAAGWGTPARDHGYRRIFASRLRVEAIQRKQVGS